MVLLGCKYLGSRPAIRGVCCLTGTPADCGSCTEDRRSRLVAAFEARKRSAFGQKPEFPEEPDFVGLVETAINRVVGSGEKPAAIEEISRRLEICRGCGHLLGISCNKCGCQFASRLVRAGSSCAAGFW